MSDTEFPILKIKIEKEVDIQLEQYYSVWYDNIGKLGPKIPQK